MVYLLSWALCHLNETDVLLAREKGGMTLRQAMVSICRSNTARQQRDAYDLFHTLNLHIKPLPSAWQELEGTFSPSG